MRGASPRSGAFWCERSGRQERREEPGRLLHAWCDLPRIIPWLMLVWCIWPLLSKHPPTPKVHIPYLVFVSFRFSKAPLSLGIFGFWIVPVVHWLYLLSSLGGHAEGTIEPNDLAVDHVVLNDALHQVGELAWVTEAARVWDGCSKLILDLLRQTRE